MVGDKEGVGMNPTEAVGVDVEVVEEALEKGIVEVATGDVDETVGGSGVVGAEDLFLLSVR